MAATLAVVLAVFIMIRVRDFKIGGRPCIFCHRRGGHAPTCPARGAW